MLGAAEATAISAVGKAEAERMKQKAAIYKQYGDAAIMSIVLEALPKVCSYNFNCEFLIIPPISDRRRSGRSSR